MIKIKRGNCPPSLDKQEKEFRKGDYKKPDVKEALLSMQHRKCCYCEINLDGSGLLMKEIEHYIPRTAEDFKDENGNPQWHLADSWTNLLFSCRNCNNKKRNKHPFDNTGGQRLLIDPTDSNCDPEDYIGFILDDGVWGHDIRGKILLGRTTSEILGFKERVDLYKKFSKIARAIQIKIDELTFALLNGNTSQVKEITNDLPKIMSAHRECAAFRRAFMAKKMQELNREIIPELERRHNKEIDRVEIDFPQGAEVRN